MIRKSPQRLLPGLTPWLLAAAVAVPATFAQTAAPARAGAAPLAPTCGVELSCRLGEVRTYDYSAVFTSEAEVETSTERGRDEVTMTGTSRLAITAIEAEGELCTYEVALETAEVHEIVGGEAVQSASGEEIADLVRDPFYFTQTSGGRITEVILGGEERPEAATFKRGVVNALGITLQAGESYQVVETDITGTHKADYVVSRLEERTELERRRAHAAEPGSGANPLDGRFATTQTARVAIDHDGCLISQVDIDETVLIAAPDAGHPPVGEHYHHETITVRAAANMTLVARSQRQTHALVGAKAAARPGAADFERRGLVRLPVDAAVDLSPSALDNAEVIAELLALLTEDAGDRELVRALSRAVRADARGVLHLESFILAERPTGELARAVGSLLISLGTPQAQDLLVDAFLSDRRLGEDRAHLIGLSTLIDRPTPRLTRAVARIARDVSAPERAGAVLALGAYAHALRPNAPGRAAKLTDRLEAELRSAGAGDETVLHLRALGNAGAVSSLPLIADHLDSYDRLTRLSAVVAMRKIDSPEVDDHLLDLLAHESSRSVQRALYTVIEERVENGLGERTPALKNTLVNWQWNQTFGGNVASANFSAGALVEDEPYLVDIHAGANAQIFGFGYTILDVQLLTEEVDLQNRRFRFFIELANNTIANIDETANCSVAAQTTLWNTSIDLVNLTSPPIPIIGPLTLSFHLDLAVRFYIDFFRDGDWCPSGELDLGITPGVALDADGYATLSLWVVRGGVGLAGTLVGIEFPVAAEADMVQQDASQVCLSIDAQLLVVDMELYAWGQYFLPWRGWQPSPRPQWTLWSFDLNPEAWNLFTLCNQNPNLRCLPDVTWWQGPPIDAQFDGANCYVTAPPAGGTPFIAGNGYYVQAVTSCPAGMPWDGTGCRDASVLIKPGAGLQFSNSGNRVTLTFQRGGSFFPPASCPAGWTTAQYTPHVSRTCERPVPSGYSASDFFMVSQSSLQHTVYVAGSAQCAAGLVAGPGCWLGDAPSGTNAFLWNGHFYYAEP